MTTRGLTYLRLWLGGNPGSPYHQPSNDIIAQLSLMPQLEWLGIEFNSNRTSTIDVANPDPSIAIMTVVTLPNLSLFYFWGFSTYLERILASLTAPVLGTFHVDLFDLPTFTIPRPFQIMASSKKLPLLHTFSIHFYADCVKLEANPHSIKVKCPLYMKIPCEYLPRLVAFTVPILHALTPFLSAVEKLWFTNSISEDCIQWIQRNNELNRIQWRELLRSFGNVKALEVTTKFVEGFPRSLCSENGEPTLELLPHLERVHCDSAETREALMPFINERQALGHPVFLGRGRG